MSVAQLIPVVLQASLGLVLISAALRSRPGDAWVLLRRPSLLGRSILSMWVIGPLLALWLVVVVPVPLPMKVALVALSIAPVPPLLPANATKLGADSAYGISLILTMSVIAIVAIPLTMLALAGLFGTSVSLPMPKILSIIMTGLIAPLVIGLVLRALLPRAAPRMAAIAKAIGTILLLAAFIPIVAKAWPLMGGLIGDGSLLVIVAFTIGMSLAGYALGGPFREDRAVLALASASRHPAIAIAIGGALFPGQKLAPAAVLLSMLVGAVAGKVIRLSMKPRARRATRTSATVSAISPSR